MAMMASPFRILLGGVILTIAASLPVWRIIETLSTGIEMPLRVHGNSSNYSLIFGGGFFSSDIEMPLEAAVNLRLGEKVWVTFAYVDGVLRPMAVSPKLVTATEGENFVVESDLVQAWRPYDDDASLAWVTVSMRIFDKRPPQYEWSEFDQILKKNDVVHILAVGEGGHAVLKAITVNGTVVWENTPW